MHQHKAVVVPCDFYKDGKVKIDEKLSRLMPLLWNLGIQTCQCCQESRPGLAEIEFDSTFGACEFLDIAQRDYHAELERWDEGISGAHAISLRLLVRLPMAEIPELEKKFKAAIARAAKAEAKAAKGKTKKGK